MLIYIRSKFTKIHTNTIMWAIFVHDENIRSFILLRRDRCTEKTPIHGTSPREKGSDGLLDNICYP